MPVFEVTEYLVYQIEADNEDDAEEICKEHPNLEPSFKLKHIDRIVREIDKVTL